MIVRGGCPAWNGKYAFVVVVEERLDGGRVVSRVCGSGQVDGQIDPIQVAIQQQGLLGVKGEPTQDVTELGALCALLHLRH